MNKIYLRPIMKDLSQGSRLSFVRQYRHLYQEDVAKKLGLNGERCERTIQNYERNDRVPRTDRLQELANIYSVSINAIREYDLKNPIDVVYILMWLEEQFDNYYIDLIKSKYIFNSNTIEMVKLYNEWMEMREKKNNGEITPDDYLEWKLNK